MPLVQIKLIEGVFSSAEKQEIIKKVTDAMVSIEGENLRPVTFVNPRRLCTPTKGSRKQWHSNHTRGIHGMEYGWKVPI